jgi:hypothetical protein
MYARNHSRCRLGKLELPALGLQTRMSSPDLLVINANVYTVDPRMPRAEAFAVSGGRFVVRW